MSWKNRYYTVFLAFFSAFGIFTQNGHAEDTGDFFSHLGGTLGTSWSIGTLGNGGMGLPSRTMDAYSIEALPTYKLGKFSIGPDFDYRWQGQIASLSSGNGTNLAGHGWLLGLGTNYALNEKFSLQGSINFLGNYTFADQTSSVENDHLSSPLGIRLKAQYFFNSLPLSVDADLQYLRWSNFTVTATDNSEASTQLMAGVGVSWHFGTRALPASASPSPPLSNDNQNGQAGQNGQDGKSL